MGVTIRPSPKQPSVNPLSGCSHFSRQPCTRLQIFRKIVWHKKTIFGLLRRIHHPSVKVHVVVCGSSDPFYLHLCDRESLLSSETVGSHRNYFWSGISIRAFILSGWDPWIELTYTYVETLTGWHRLQTFVICPSSILRWCVEVWSGRSCNARWVVRPSILRSRLSASRPQPTRVIVCTASNTPISPISPISLISPILAIRHSPRRGWQKNINVIIT